MRVNSGTKQKTARRRLSISCCAPTKHGKERSSCTTRHGDIRINRKRYGDYGQYKNAAKPAHCFISPSPSARACGVCSRYPVAWLLLRRCVLISWRSKLCPFSSRAAPEVARPPRASMVGQLGAGPASFHLQTHLDQAADGFGAASPVLDRSGIDRCKHGLRQANVHTGVSPTGGRTTALF
jgi:hypothetical protein